MIRTLILVCMIAALAFGAPKQKNKKPAATPAKAAAKPAKPRPRPTVPAGAVEYEPGAWRYTDPAGKTWIYRNTPFGLTRYEASPEPGASKRPAGVPAGAVEVEPNLWRFTDASGKEWLYRNTPFGLSKNAAQPAAEAPADENAGVPAGMTARDLGDKVSFEQPTPFGVHKWTKPKTGLTELERKVFERDSQKTQEPK